MKRFITVLISLGLVAGLVSCSNSNAEDNLGQKCVAEYFKISDDWFNALAQFSDAKDSLTNFRFALDQDIVNAEDREDLLDATEKARNQFSEFSEWVVKELSQLQEQRENLFNKYADNQNRVCAQIGQSAKRISVPYETTIIDVLRQKELLLTNS
tara:strand:+ start:107 stop:571 length:465 start_codon:yes stop_codon:yes gene_type:complete